VALRGPRSVATLMYPRHVGHGGCASAKDGTKQSHWRTRRSRRVGLGTSIAAVPCHIVAKANLKLAFLTGAVAACLALAVVTTGVSARAQSSWNGAQCPVSLIGSACDAGNPNLPNAICIPATCSENVDSGGNFHAISSRMCAACVDFGSPSIYCTDICKPCSDSVNYGIDICIDAGPQGWGWGTPANPDQFTVTFQNTFCVAHEAGIVAELCSNSPSEAGSAFDANDRIYDAGVVSDNNDLWDGPPAAAPGTVFGNAGAGSPREPGPGAPATSGTGGSANPGSGGSSVSTVDAAVGDETVVGHGPFGCDAAGVDRSQLPYGVGVFAAWIVFAGVRRRATHGRSVPK
jgi:hypothetical protein